MPALILRYLPHIAAVIALIGAIGWYGHHREQSGYEKAQAEMSEAVRKAEEATRVAEIESRKRVEAVDREYQNQLQSLDAKYRDASARIGAISVRKCPSGGSALSRNHEPASGDHDPASADGFSRDISGDIERLLKQADEQTQRLIACQKYAASL